MYGVTFIHTDSDLQSAYDFHAHVIIIQISMTEKSDHLLRFGVRTLPAIGGVQRSAMLVGGTPFSYGSTSETASDPCRNSPGMIRVYYSTSVNNQREVVSVSTVRLLNVK